MTDTTEPQTKWGADHVGCLYDGHLGIYIYPEIIRLALTHGMEWSDPGAERVWEEDRENDVASEAMIELSDEAEQWLNDNLAAEGFGFGWNDGEYFFQTDEWWEEEAG